MVKKAKDAFGKIVDFFTEKPKFLILYAIFSFSLLITSCSFLAYTIKNTKPANPNIIMHALSSIEMVWSDLMNTPEKIDPTEVVDDELNLLQFVSDETVEASDPAAGTDSSLTEEASEPTEPQWSEDGIYLIVNEEVYATGNVHIRSIPSKYGAKLGILFINAKITRIGIGTNGWSKVLCDGKEGYITSYYLSPTKRATYTEVNQPVYAIKNCKIRSGPNIQSKILGVLPKNSEIIRIALGSDGWDQVLYDGEIAYMYSLYLTIDPPLTNADSE